MNNPEATLIDGSESANSLYLYLVHFTASYGKPEHNLMTLR